MASLTLTSVAKKDRSATALDGVDLHVRDGEFFVLLGRPARARPPR